jgi:hypothetical protein
MLPPSLGGIPFRFAAKTSEAEFPQTLVFLLKKLPVQLGGAGLQPVPSYRNTSGFPHDPPTANTAEEVAPQMEVSAMLAPLLSSSEVLQPLPS